MTRIPLPNRRPSETIEATWGVDHPQHFSITIGFDALGFPQEVFAGEAKGDLLAIIADACIILSMALQNNIAPRDLAKSLGRVPAHIIQDGQIVKTEAPASPLGVIVGCIIEAMP